MFAYNLRMLLKPLIKQSMRRNRKYIRNLSISFHRNKNKFRKLSLRFKIFVILCFLSKRTHLLNYEKNYYWLTFLGFLNVSSTSSNNIIFNWCFIYCFVQLSSLSIELDLNLKIIKKTFFKLYLFLICYPNQYL